MKYPEIDPDQAVTIVQYWDTGDSVSCATQFKKHLYQGL